VQPIDGLYPVEVINSFGCTDRDTVRVSFIDIEVYIPNVVSTSSPNNNNSMVNPGVFVYLITYNFNGEQVSVSGDVTVL